MKFKAETFDKLQHLFQIYKFNDRHLHCIIDFENKLDFKLLTKAVRATIEVVPIIGCRYVEDKKAPFWETVPCIKSEDLILVTSSKSEFDNFITSETNLFIGPQLKLCVLQGEQNSMAVIMNHMICDAAGFKQYLYLLCDIYSELSKNQNYKSTYKLLGSRSLDRVLNTLTKKEKIKALLLQNKESNKDCGYVFPMSAIGDIWPFIVTTTIERDSFLFIKEYCKTRKVTINDVVLAAYYRVLYKTLDIKENNPITVPIMIDMRRYLRDKEIDGLCNLASSAGTNLEHDSKDSFETTVRKISESIKAKKDNFLGINAFMKMSLLYKILSYSQAKKLLKKGFKNPHIAMTNIGILDSKKLYFSGNTIKSAYMCGSIKYPPYFQLAVSSFDNTMTFSVNLYGDKQDKKNFEKFLEELKSELPSK